ncbi:hypothetical protein, partial [Pseudomonas sp.]|uniref:hypothetical protein n=1 Tax=Pseudomonas sp. TaxID=306 RepID=UPI002601EC1E
LAILRDYLQLSQWPSEDCLTSCLRELTHSDVISIFSVFGTGVWLKILHIMGTKSDLSLQAVLTKVFDDLLVQSERRETMRKEAKKISLIYEDKDGISPNSLAGVAFVALRHNLSHVDN